MRLPNGSPILYPALPVADQNLFTSALLAACDALDGATDGVIDNAGACAAKFDPATFVFANGQPLQCTGTKTATCLTAAQIDAIKKINQGPRDARGASIKAPAGGAAHTPINATIFGYPYDGSSPQARLIYVNGTLYGTTHDGGTHGYGTVYALTP